MIELDCLTEHCEFSSHSIPTTVWHRIFKVNQTLCSDVTQSVQQRLAFLHACSTVSSKPAAFIACL